MLPARATLEFAEFDGQQASYVVRWAASRKTEDHSHRLRRVACLGSCAAAQGVAENDPSAIRTSRRVGRLKFENGFMGVFLKCLLLEAGAGASISPKK